MTTQSSNRPQTQAPIRTTAPIAPPLAQPTGGTVVWAHPGHVQAYGYSLTAMFTGTVHTSQKGKNYLSVQCSIDQALVRPDEVIKPFRMDGVLLPDVEPDTAIALCAADVTERLHRGTNGRANLYVLGQVGARLDGKGWPALYINLESELNARAAVNSIAGFRVYAKVSGTYTWLNVVLIQQRDPALFFGSSQYKELSPMQLPTNEYPDGQIPTLEFLAHQSDILELAYQSAALIYQSAQ